MFVGNDKGQVIVDLHFCPQHDDDPDNDDDDPENDDDCQVLKIVNFAGAKPSDDGSSLPSPVLVEELPVSQSLLLW